ncbi:MAG TPA: 30S ribosomal protein S6 [Dehalococcoidia bacterium]|nr:30S ribosomal protein S6 [Dehalococcoidia bacterium]
MARKVAVKKAKIEEQELRDYELVVILNPDIAEDDLEATLGKINQFIGDKGGTIDSVEQWGKRKLAYPLKHFTEGSYVLVRFKLGAKLTGELEANLRISEAVLRHLLVKLSD